MFQNVEHEDQSIVLAGLKGFVKGTESNLPAMGVVLGNQGSVRLQTFDVAKSGKLIEKKGVATTNIENV